MSEKLDLLVELVRELREDVKIVRDVQVRQGSDIQHNKDSLVEHMKRSDLLETEVELLKKDVDMRLEKLEATPTFIRTLVMLTLKVGGIIGVVYTALQVWKYLKP